MRSESYGRWRTWIRKRQFMSELDRVIHEPARLRILSLLSGAGTADFTFVMKALGLTNGNLSCHMDKLEKAGYIEVSKTFQGKLPLTTYTITPTGRHALTEYWDALESIRGLAK